MEEEKKKFEEWILIEVGREKLEQWFYQEDGYENWMEMGMEYLEDCELEGIEGSWEEYLKEYWTEELRKRKTYPKYSIFFFSVMEKKLKWCCHKKAGRNFLGRICVQHQGGGKKILHYHLDLYRRINLYGVIIKVTRQPGRSSFIGTIWYTNGLMSNIIIAHGVHLGSKLFNGIYLPRGYDFDEARGSSMLIKNFNLFTTVCNLESSPYSGGKLALAAGVSAVLSTFNGKVYGVKLSSGWQTFLSPTVLVTLGRISNIRHRADRIGKAGTARKLGIRPTVRGVAKNPCDHPHGGGEGKGSPPRAQVSPWGKLTKGTPTNNKKYHRILRRKFKQLPS